MTLVDELTAYVECFAIIEAIKADQAQISAEIAVQQSSDPRSAFADSAPTALLDARLVDSDQQISDLVNRILILKTV